MKLTAVTIVLTLAASAGAGAARSPVAVIASPAHVSLTGSGSSRVAVTNSGSQPVAVDAAPTGFSLDLRGRPRIVRRRASWLAVRPRHLVLAPGAIGALRVAAHVPPRSEPGDHSELVLLTTRPSTTHGLPVRLRLGVVVVVRAPGRVIRRLTVVRMWAPPYGVHALDVLLANRGNVTETVGGSCALLWLHRNGRLLARLHAPERRILPRTSGLLELDYRAHVNGSVRVRVAPAKPGCPRIAPKEVVVRF